MLLLAYRLRPVQVAKGNIIKLCRELIGTDLA
jgi:hypothetical protein